MFDEKLFSEIYLRRLCLNIGREMYNFIFWGREFKSDAPAKVMLILKQFKPWPGHVEFISVM